jgi:hypothetical protein
MFAVTLGASDIMVVVVVVLVVETEGNELRLMESRGLSLTGWFLDSNGHCPPASGPYAVWPLHENIRKFQSESYMQTIASQR